MTLTGSVTANEVGGIFTSGDFTATVSALFGWMDEIHTAPHAGTDLAAIEGTPIPNLCAGTVVFASVAGTPGWAEVFGNSCIVDHGDGTRALYAHMLAVPVHYSAVPAPVAVGAILGHVGNTGYSFGAHLHLGLSTDGNPWFNKDADGGVSLLLDPLAHLGAGQSEVFVPADAQEPDGYAVLAHAAQYQRDLMGRLATMAEARVPRFAMQSERDAAIPAATALVAAIDSLGG